MQLKLTTIAAGALALSLTACIPPAPEPTPAPTPAPSPTPTAAAIAQTGQQAPLPVSDPADDWHDRALTPGDWRYVRKQGHTMAEYAADPLAPTPLLTIAFGTWLTGDEIGWPLIVGGGLAIIGVAIIVIRPSRNIFKPLLVRPRL